MKKHSLVLVFAICSTALVLSRNAWAQEAGHYQLFQGKYTHWDLDQNTSTEKNEIFLLDTTNGNVQVYVSTSKDGKETKYWAPATVDEAKKTLTITTTAPSQ